MLSDPGRQEVGVQSRAGNDESRCRDSDCTYERAPFVQPQDLSPNPRLTGDSLLDAFNCEDDCSVNAKTL